jgi:hypothetical protein
MNTKLLIPKKCKVGFNPRTDTYTGKLGYIIAHDGKKWRKEPSWEGWIYNVKDSEYVASEKSKQYNARLQSLKDSYTKALSSNDSWSKNVVANYTLETYIETYLGSFDTFHPNIGRTTSDVTFTPFEFDNVPTEGFVLNKKAGGYSSGWNHRATYCRVYDPRGFEFEINIPNLLYILQECNAYKGKGLEGEFVYGWDGKDLVLLPVSSPEFTESTNFTKIQTEKVSSKDLIVGATYMDKNLDNYVYLGRFDYIDYDWKGSVSVERNAYLMYSLKYSKIIRMTGLSSIAKLVNADTHANYAKFLSEFSDSKHAYNFQDFEEGTISFGKLDYHARIGKSFGKALIKVADGEYDIYDMILRENERYGSSYYDYIVKRFDLISKKRLFINSDKTINVKPTRVERIITDLSPRNLKNHVLLKLSAKLENNKTYTINF